MSDNKQEHPEDREFREEGERYAAAHAHEFCEAHRAELERLISLYPDSAAEDLLLALREQFWAKLWTPSGGS